MMNTNIPEIQITPAPEKPLMIYDGDCGFCQKWISRWHQWTGDRVVYEPSQTAAIRFPLIPKDRYERSVQLIDRDGKVYEGAQAVFRGLSVLWWGKRLLALYRYLPGFAWAHEKAYRWVARHRKTLSPSCEVEKIDKK